MITLGEPIALPVEGGTLTAYRVGSATGRTDVPVVLAVHGITATAAAWLAVADALGQAATLLAVDLRGRGEHASGDDLRRPDGLPGLVAGPSGDRWRRDRAVGA